MDKQSKVVIVALVVLGVVFALGLGTNLMPKKGEPEGGKKADKEQQEKSVDGYDRNGWLGSMDKLIGRFSPRLDVRRLQGPAPGAQCRLNNNVLELFARNADCVLTIRPRLRDCDDDYESMTLMLAKQATATRDAAARIKMNPALMQAQPLSRLKMRPAVILPTLVAMYQPKGKSIAAVKKRDQEFRLVVLEQGGTLTLKCTNCSKDQPVKVSLATRKSCED